MTNRHTAEEKKLANQFYREKDKFVIPYIKLAARLEIQIFCFEKVYIGQITPS